MERLDLEAGRVVMAMLFSEDSHSWMVSIFRAGGGRWRWVSRAFFRWWKSPSVRVYLGSAGKRVNAAVREHNERPGSRLRQPRPAYFWRHIYVIHVGMEAARHLPGMRGSRQRAVWSHKRHNVTHKERMTTLSV